MVDAFIVAPKRSKWPRRLRRIFTTLVVLALLVVVAYFVVTSSAFLSGVILPRVSKAVNAKITVGDASISPFSKIDLHHVKIETTGTDPVLQADEVLLSYNLRDILGGNYHIDEATVLSPVIVVTKNADGTSNLDPLLQHGTNQPAKPVTSKSETPLRLDVRKIALNNAVVRLVQNHQDGGTAVTELSNVNITVADLKNGQAGKMTLAADLKLDDQVPAPGTNSLLQAKASGTFTLNLSPDAKSAGINGSAQFDVQKAAGALGDLSGFGARLDCDTTPTEIKQIALAFQKDGKNLGLIHASGPLDLAKTEGHIKVEITSIDHQVLDLVGAGSGLTFGPTTISSTNQIDLASGGNAISVAGQLGIANLAVTKENLTTPALDLRAGYDVALNRADHSTLLRTVALDGTQNRQPFLHAELAGPMNIGAGSPMVGSNGSGLKLAVTRLNLADWKSLLGGSISNGLVNLTATVSSQNGGKTVALDFSSSVDGLGAQTGGKQTNAPGLSFQAGGKVDLALDKRTAEFHPLQVTLAPTARATNQLTLTGQLDLSDAKAIQGSLTLASDSLDVTPLYDMFAGPAKAAGTSAPAPKHAAPPAAAPEAEPAALHLPVRDFSFDARIRRFYLREVDAKDFEAGAKIDGSHVLVNPFQFELNGAPAKATVDLNLGVPGYEYKIAFSANQVPVAPLVDSFLPDYAGQMKGDLFASGKIQGAGVTGASLQTSLNGQASLTFTNADIQLTGATKEIVTIVATALGLPELTGSPINWLGTSLTVTDAVVNLAQLQAISPTFGASSQGTISIEKVLTNSTYNNLPVSISFAPTLAQKARLAPANLGTNGAYVDLGRVAEVNGTIGNPKTKADTVAIAMLTAKALPIGGEVGKALREVPNIGGLLGGQGGATNQPATNSTTGRNENILRGLGGLLNQRPAATNQTSTNR